MLIPFKKNQRKSMPVMFLTIDLGSSLIKVNNFSLNEGVATLKESFFASLPLGASKLGVPIDINLIEKKLTSILKNSEGESFKGKKVIVGLSGESVFGFTTTVRLSRKNPQAEITEGEISEIVKQIKELSLIEASKLSGQKFGSDNVEVDLVNSSIVSTLVDGIYVQDLSGNIGKQLEIGLFTSFSPRNILFSIQDLCKSLKLDFVTATSQMYSIVKMLSFDNPSEFNAIVMDLGSEKTDIAVSFGGGIISTRTLDFGGNQLSKALAERLKIPFSEAEEAKLHLEESSLNGRLKEVLDNVLDLWISGIEVALRDFEGIKTFPSKIYLVGGGASTYNLKHILETSDWYKNLPFKEGPKVEIVSSNTSSAISDFEGYINSPGNIGPASLGLVGLEVFGK